jgi:hypothetical protein
MLAMLASMPGQSRLGNQLAEVTAALGDCGAAFALIGGLALAPHKVIRGTQDIDLLVHAVAADTIHAVLTKLGYHSLHRSAEAANYARNDERLDLLYATRPIAIRLLGDAREFSTEFGAFRVVSAEGLIGLKLQAMVNNRRRTQDLEDIRSLLKANAGALNLNEIREYFRLFDREHQLDELLQQVG